MPVAPRSVNDVSYHLCHTSFGETWIDSRSAKCSIFLYNMRSEGEKVSSANGRGQFCNFMVGSWSNRPRILNDVSTVFGQFLLDFGMQLFVAGAVFGDVGG